MSKSIAHLVFTAVQRIVKMILVSVLITSGLMHEITAQNSVHFNEEGAYLEVPHHPGLESDVITIEFWLNVDEAGIEASGEQNILDKRQGDQGFNIRLAGTEFPLPVFSFFLPENEIHAFPGVQRKRWNHFAYVISTTTSQIFQNGVLLNEITSGDFDIASPASLRIGEFLGYPNASLRLRGELDEFRIWSTARTSTQIIEHMHQSLTGGEQNLELYFDFEEPASDIVYDRSPNQNHAIIFGSPDLLPSNAPIGFIPLAPPVGFRSYGTEHVIELEWESVPEASTYRIYRSINKDFDVEPLTLLTEVSGSENAYTDDDVDPETLYYYIIAAVDQDQHEGLPGNLSVTRLSQITDYFTGVYYYPWYLPNQNHHPWPGEYPRYFMEPRPEPLLGHYSSDNPVIMNQHFDWMESADINFIVSSWWGPGSQEDVVLREAIVPEIEKRSLRFAVYFESAMLGSTNGEIPFTATTIPVFKSHFANLASEYFGHPNYLKIDGRPVVFIYLAHIFSGDYVQAYTEMRELLLQEGIDVFLIGDVNVYAPFDPAHAAVVDGLSPYIPLASLQGKRYPHDIDFLNTFANAYARLQAELIKLNKLFVPNVFPGFNNRRTDSGFVFPRQSGLDDESTSLFEQLIKVSRPFIDTETEMIMITSWNEWHEDSQIEPTIISATTTTDVSPSGNNYTLGYPYSGYGTALLDLTLDLLGDSTTVSVAQVEERESEWTVFPVPVMDVIYLQCMHEIPGAIEVSLMTIEGKTLRSATAHSLHPGERIEIKLPDVIPGAYLLIVKTDLDWWSKLVVSGR